MSCKRLPFFIAAVAVALAIFTHTASADSYHLISLGSDNGKNIYGIDTSGDLVVENLNGDCSGPYTACYFETSPTGAPLGVTALPPSLSYDNGSPCTGAPPAGFYELGAAKCNNGREVFGGEYYNPALYTTLCAGPISGLAETIFCGNDGELLGVFTGFDPFADWIQASGDEIDLNAAGDFGFIDGRDEITYLAIDLTPSTTPEPGTVDLVATGGLALFWVLRRRFVHA
jgi:hypothetical protein